MKKIGTYKIYLTGSKKYIDRTVYLSENKYFIKFYKQIIEAKTSHIGFATIDEY